MTSAIDHDPSTFIDGSNNNNDSPNDGLGADNDGGYLSSTLDDAFWESLAAHDPLLFGALPVPVDPASGSHPDWGEAGLGFELGFGAGAVAVDDVPWGMGDVDMDGQGVAVQQGGGLEIQQQQQQQQGQHVSYQQQGQQQQQQQWRERGFDLLDGWLVNGRTFGI